jgi:hypothetical protein
MIFGDCWEHGNVSSDFDVSSPASVVVASLPPLTGIVMPAT